MKETVTVNGREYRLFPVDTTVLVGSHKAIIQERIITEKERVFYKVTGFEILFPESDVQSFKSV